MRIRLAVLAVASILTATPSLALQQRSFVASTGSDAAACTLPAPCRSFAAAIAKTAPYGEVVVLDSAGYGPVTITKSVSIIAPQGVYAGVTVSSGDGITVDFPGAIVALRGLSINGQGGAIGINVKNATRVHIEGCVISNMASNGILDIAPFAELSVLDTIVRNTAGTGIGIAADSSVVIDHVRSEHNSFDGFYIVPGATRAKAVITDSIFAWNGANGISVDSFAGGITNVDVERSTLSDNGTGLTANGNGGREAVAVAHSAILRNTVAGVAAVSSADFVIATISYNSFVDNPVGIIADGVSAYIYAHANSLASLFAMDFETTSAGKILTYLDNVGSVSAFGNIIPVSGN